MGHQTAQNKKKIKPYDINIGMNKYYKIIVCENSIMKILNSYKGLSSLL